MVALVILLRICVDASVRHSDLLQYLVVAVVDGVVESHIGRPRPSLRTFALQAAATASWLLKVGDEAVELEALKIGHKSLLLLCISCGMYFIVSTLVMRRKCDVLYCTAGVLDVSTCQCVMCGTVCLLDAVF